MNKELLAKVNKNNVWDETPVFCFSSDIDWASEKVLERYFTRINQWNVKPNLFVTHDSQEIANQFNDGKIERGIHPNFILPSSHGNIPEEIIEFVIKLAPESYGFRGHRMYEHSGVAHILKNNYGYKYSSNLTTVMQKNIKPFLHESGLISFPIFFEDGTQLYNKLDLDFNNYIDYFTSPGLKIINFHPIDYVLNSDSYEFMRNVRDNTSWEEYNIMDSETIDKFKNNGKGISNMIDDIYEFVEKNDYPIMTLNEMYETIIEN